MYYWLEGEYLNFTLYLYYFLQGKAHVRPPLVILNKLKRCNFASTKVKKVLLKIPRNLNQIYIL